MLPAPAHLLDAYRMTASNRAVGCSDGVTLEERLGWAHVANRRCRVMRDACHDPGHDLARAEMRLRAGLIELMGPNARVELLDCSPIIAWTAERVGGESTTEVTENVVAGTTSLSMERLRRLRRLKLDLKPNGAGGQVPSSTKRFSRLKI